MSFGTVVRRKLKDRALPEVVVTVKVLPLPSSSQYMMKKAIVSCRSWELLIGMEITMLTPTVLATLMAVLVEVRLVVGLGVPPRAERVVEGVGELLGDGRLVMDSLG